MAIVKFAPYMMIVGVSIPTTHNILANPLNTPPHNRGERVRFSNNKQLPVYVWTMRYNLSCIYRVLPWIQRTKRISRTQMQTTWKKSVKIIPAALTFINWYKTNKSMFSVRVSRESLWEFIFIFCFYSWLFFSTRNYFDLLNSSFFFLSPFDMVSMYNVHL